DFVGIARSFGVAGIDLDGCPNAFAALEQELRRPGPCLIHCSIDAREGVYPMVPPGAANTEMIGTGAAESLDAAESLK
ncbi:MAG TPA: hypothetical protein VKQ06_12765, partial [Gammaproteobacteria bacterium]|nr:hypothetical protein [Gammaproteobacteria bacterium]